MVDYFRPVIGFIKCFADFYDPKSIALASLRQT